MWGLLYALADVPDHSLLLTWGGDPFKRLSAPLVVSDDGIAGKTLTFHAAYCVGYQENFESGNEHLGSYVNHCALSETAGIGSGGDPRPTWPRPCGSMGCPGQR
ncbi:hypothetical protein [Hymenobacter terrenus]|uniref:hypothetical protein n=1 Tax=Hymenobacter terrenus TaxID=1629124 RepID=UPI0018CD124A